MGGGNTPRHQISLTNRNTHTVSGGTDVKSNGELSDPPHTDDHSREKRFAS